MPRVANIKTPKYCKHKASGQAIVTLNGRDIYLGTFGTAASREEYDRLISEWLAAGRTLARRAANPSVTELLAAYNRFLTTYYVKNGKPTGEQDCIKAALRPLRRLYGRSTAAEFGPMALKAVRQSMVDADCPGGHRCDRQRNRGPKSVRIGKAPGGLSGAELATDGTRQGI